MNRLTEDQINEQIAGLNSVGILNLTEPQLQLLNDLEAELLRRHPERNTTPQAPAPPQAQGK